MLNIQNLYKHYEGIIAVDNVDLSVIPGTITGIYGDNGAGKTTLFNLISGFEKPDKGCVIFKGKDITHKSVIYRAKHGMGRLFQIPRFFNNVSVLDNLLAAGKNHEAEYLHNYLFKYPLIKKNNNKMVAKAQKILTNFQLSDKAGLKAFELSGGEKKLLSLGCLLMNEAMLLLLDEPFAGINNKMFESLKDIFLSLRNNGITMLIIEHDLDILKNISDRLIEMKNGKIYER